ncbi:hypothetical protein, partial [Silvimonas sp.]|uniref:hypothetical protein n=1 Tax=Silvimonas sp. TaxID=2650811 RepID=UPI00284794F0
IQFRTRYLRFHINSIDTAVVIPNIMAKGSSRKRIVKAKEDDNVEAAAESPASPHADEANAGLVQTPATAAAPEEEAKETHEGGDEGAEEGGSENSSDDEDDEDVTDVTATLSGPPAGGLTEAMKALLTAQHEATVARFEGLLNAAMAKRPGQTSDLVRVLIEGLEDDEPAALVSGHHRAAPAPVVHMLPVRQSDGPILDFLTKEAVMVFWPAWTRFLTQLATLGAPRAPVQGQLSASCYKGLSNMVVGTRYPGKLALYDGTLALSAGGHAKLRALLEPSGRSTLAQLCYTADGAYPTGGEWDVQFNALLKWIHDRPAEKGQTAVFNLLKDIQHLLDWKWRNREYSDTLLLFTADFNTLLDKYGPDTLATGAAVKKVITGLIAKLTPPAYKVEWEHRAMQRSWSSVDEFLYELNQPDNAVLYTGIQLSMPKGVGTPQVHTPKSAPPAAAAKRTVTLAASEDSDGDDSDAPEPAGKVRVVMPTTPGTPRSCWFCKGPHTLRECKTATAADRARILKKRREFRGKDSAAVRSAPAESESPKSTRTKGKKKMKTTSLCTVSRETKGGAETHATAAVVAPEGPRPKKVAKKPTITLVGTEAVSAPRCDTPRPAHGAVEVEEAVAYKSGVHVHGTLTTPLLTIPFALDSGATHTFIADTLVAPLKGRREWSSPHSQRRCAFTRRMARASWPPICS